MKSRIIDTLKTFSSDAVINDSNSMFESLVLELGLSPSTLIERSNTLLQNILHNYASFDISTIDKFNHKIIRTFAYDLKLPMNFEVELDQEALLNEAVDSLIQKTGDDKLLSETLIEFALEKADDDRSWDITYDLNKISKRLLSENDLSYLKQLGDKTLYDFKSLKETLSKNTKDLESAIQSIASDMLTLIDECGLQFDDFSGSYLPKHFNNLTNKKFDLNFNAKWQEDIDTRVLYPKRVTEDIAAIINDIQPQIASAFLETKTQVFELLLLKNIYKNITPLSVLNAIKQELENLKVDQNKLLISEFNSIIAEEIKDQPTPYIYERLGEKFKHYFIDEFQDTSQMQWSNLQPLISNALEQEQFGKTGSLMLVGDAKQAIYRWRGGYAEQFINLFNKAKNPFFVEQKVESLDYNYRSFQEIINFNNGFFEHLSKTAFVDPSYKTLYETANQKAVIENQGYVGLTFLDIQRDDDRDLLYAEQTYNTIKKCLDNGFELGDICVLVRKKREGLAVSNYLTEQGIAITSSETLLLKNSKSVLFINAVLRLLIQPNNDEAKAEVLYHIASSRNIEHKHSFFKKYLSFQDSEFFTALEELGIIVDTNELFLKPLYSVVETIIEAFKLKETSNAYLLFYLDTVMAFSEKPLADISGFLDYFEKKENELAISAPEGQNAVQVMTIHKSKGLEFPVVIFPFADLDIYREKEPMSWLTLDPETYDGFTHTLLNFNKNVQYYGEQGQHIYNKHIAELELDNINLLYVALTRAIEQLHVISKQDVDRKGVPKATTYSGKLIDYLLNIGVWDGIQQDYSFGNPERKSDSDSKAITNTIAIELTEGSTKDLQVDLVTSSGLLWDTKQEQAIEKGNLIHDLMALVKTKSDIPSAIQNFIREGVLQNEQAPLIEKTIQEIVNHPDISDFYSEKHTIYNERNILLKDGGLLRPDRLVFTDNKKVVIMDYKTGLHSPHHKDQLQKYTYCLEDMGFEVVKKILIYINDDITIKEL